MISLLQAQAKELSNNLNDIKDKKTFNVIYDPIKIQALLLDATSYPEDSIEYFIKENYHKINRQLQITVTKNKNQIYLQINNLQQGNIFLLTLEDIYHGYNDFYYINDDKEQINYFLDFKNYLSIIKDNNKSNLILQFQQNNYLKKYLLYINKFYMVFEYNIENNNFKLLNKFNLQKNKDPILENTNILKIISDNETKKITRLGNFKINNCPITIIASETIHEFSKIILPINCRMFELYKKKTKNKDAKNIAYQKINKYHKNAQYKNFYIKIQKKYYIIANETSINFSSYPKIQDLQNPANQHYILYINPNILNMIINEKQEAMIVKYNHIIKKLQVMEEWEMFCKNNTKKVNKSSKLEDPINSNDETNNLSTGLSD